MTECTRCGTDTTRNALTSEAPVENSENGVVWLCDSCMDEFNEWLDGSDELTERQRRLYEEGARMGAEEAAEKLHESRREWLGNE